MMKELCRSTWKCARFLRLPMKKGRKRNMSERRWWMPVFQMCTLMRWEMCWEPGKGLGMDRESWLRDIQTLFSKGRQTLL